MRSDIRRFAPKLANEQRLAGLMNLYYERRGLKVIRRNDTSAFDVMLGRGRYAWTVEEKFRFKRKREDLAIEVVQNVMDGLVGWLSEVKADNLHYVFCRGEAGEEVPQVVVALDWPRFREWYVARLAEVGRAECVVSRKGVGVSLNLVVALEHVPVELMRVYEVPALVPAGLVAERN